VNGDRQARRLDDLCEDLGTASRLSTARFAPIGSLFARCGRRHQRRVTSHGRLTWSSHETSRRRSYTFAFPSTGTAKAYRARRARLSRSPGCDLGGIAGIQSSPRDTTRSPLRSTARGDRAAFARPTRRACAPSLRRCVAADPAPVISERIKGAINGLGLAAYLSDAMARSHPHIMKRKLLSEIGPVSLGPKSERSEEELPSRTGSGKRRRCATRNSSAPNS